MLETRTDYAGKLAEIKFGDKLKASEVDPKIEEIKENIANKTLKTPKTKKSLTDYFNQRGKPSAMAPLGNNIPSQKENLEPRNLDCPFDNDLQLAQDQPLEEKVIGSQMVQEKPVSEEQVEIPQVEMVVEDKVEAPIKVKVIEPLFAQVQTVYESVVLERPPVVEKVETMVEEKESEIVQEEVEEPKQVEQVQEAPVEAQEEAMVAETEVPVQEMAQEEIAQPEKVQEIVQEEVQKVEEVEMVSENVEAIPTPVTTTTTAAAVVTTTTTTVTAMEAEEASTPLEVTEQVEASEPQLETEPVSEPKACFQQVESQESEFQTTSFIFMREVVAQEKPAEIPEQVIKAPETKAVSSKKDLSTKTSLKSSKKASISKLSKKIFKKKTLVQKSTKPSPGQSRVPTLKSLGLKKAKINTANKAMKERLNKVTSKVGASSFGSRTNRFGNNSNTNKAKPMPRKPAVPRMAAFKKKIAGKVLKENKLSSGPDSKKVSKRKPPVPSFKKIRKPLSKPTLK